MYAISGGFEFGLRRRLDRFVWVYWRPFRIANYMTRWPFAWPSDTTGVRCFPYIRITIIIYFGTPPGSRTNNFCGTPVRTRRFRTGKGTKLGGKTQIKSLRSSDGQISTVVWKLHGVNMTGVVAVEIQNRIEPPINSRGIESTNSGYNARKTDFRVDFRKSRAR